MSTLSGLASKGEKGKLKYQSLDINNLYRASRGESSEKQQQKSAPTFKYGMQSLGRVPSARRPPANLPSIKSEHSGTDAAVSLVPSGGPGWGKQDSVTPSTSTTPSTTSTTTNCNANSPSPANIPLTAHQAAIALPVTTTNPPPTKHSTSSVTPAATDKSWSSVMSGNDMIHPPPYQSPQFQHEFPSLSAGDGGGQARSGTSDTQYGPGPSLRPQTEGSWMQGGSRANADPLPRSNSAPLGPPPQLSAQAGLAHQALPPQYHGILPNFMFRGNAATNGHGTSTVANAPPLVMNNNRNRVENRPASIQRATDTPEEVSRRPIIKEEDLNRMDDMTKDMGWAAQDEIDYNQKLEFSDDEAMPERNIPRNIMKSISKESDSKDRQDKTEAYQEEAKNYNRNGNNGPNTYNRGRNPDEDEILALRRRQQHQVVTTATERAKQRKEEEEKKYQEAKLKSKREKDQEDSQGTISPSIVPPQPITPTSIPVPDWDKEKEGMNAINEINEDNRNSAPNNKVSRDVTGSDFRQMAQIEAKNFVRKDNRNADRGNSGYPRQMQNLPPRLQKKHQLRNNSSPQPPMGYTQYDPRWINPGQNMNKTSPTSSLHKMRNDWEGSSDKERDEERIRYSNEDIRRGTPAMYDTHMVTRQSSDEWHSDHRHDKYRDEKSSQDRVYERPQRPDSRDSRASRDSRHSRESRESMRDSEPREHLGSWAESIAYEERKKESKEDRRQVPGPITKEKIEADEKQNEKRNLTQLKKGSVPPAIERKNDVGDKMQEKDSNSWSNPNKETINTYDDISKPWADDTSSQSAQDISKLELDNSKKNTTASEPNTPDVVKEDIDLKKLDIVDVNKEKDEKRSHPPNRNRLDNRSQPWDRNSGSGMYRSWYKKSKGAPRSSKPTSKGGDCQCTDSDGSIDEISCSNDSHKDDKGLRNNQKSPKPTSKKFEKDDKNKEIAKSDKLDKFDKFEKPDRPNERKMDRYPDSRRDTYEPRGEPSRLGRGGGNMRGRGGLSKRIDGYGPPSLKSPFGHSEEKDKKSSMDDSALSNADNQSMDKAKTNNAGIIGSTRREPPSSNLSRMEKKHDDKFDRGKPRRSSDSRKPRPPGRLKDENDTSEHSDDSINKQNRKGNKSPLRSRSSNMISRRNQPPRLSGEKRSSYNQPRGEYMSTRQNSSGSLRSGSAVVRKDNVIKDEKQADSSNSLCNAIADISFKAKEQNEEIDVNEVEGDEKSSGHGDSDGFQEVKSKKNVKERQKIEEKPVIKQIGPKPETSLIKQDRKPKSMTSQLSQQQIANLPSLMDTPVNPPAVIPQPGNNKNPYDRCRNNKLPPRLARQREQGRLQKVQIHQHGMCDVNDIKVPQNIGLYGLKDNSSSMQITNAWDKPIQLRSNMEAEPVLSIGIENCKSMDQPHSPGQTTNSPNTEKVIGKTDRNQMQDKSVLDGTTPPVNTIIFENTNYKSTPAVRNNRNDKARSNKLDDSPSNIETSVMSGFNKPISDLLSKNDKTDIPMQLSFNKEDSADMKLDFFESDISHLTDDKSTKNLSLPKSMHAITSSNSTISPSTADLNFKIASVKKVWDNTMMPPVLEHSIGQEDNNSSFSTSFGPDPNTLDASSAFSKGTDTSDDTHEGYSSSPNQNVPNSTTNVCKVKPTQQVPGTTGQNVGAHQQHSGIISSGLIAPLSSPPIQPVIGPSVGLNQAPQQYTTNQHIGYQAGLGGSSQYGVPAIPSPPVVYNSTQQLQPQAGLYGGFPIDQLGGQRTSQFSQYATPYNLGQTASSPYSAQSLYLPTAQPHGPPAAQAPPDLYQSINNYRIPNTAPYGQNQQLNNPTTVLISSTSNSLMSASVKPSSQPISAIGTKTGTINQTFQQQSQQGQQPLYMTYEPAMQANYLPNTGVMQRGPPGPVQNNVVPTLQASSSFYSGSTGGQTGYFQQPGNSTLQSGPLQQHQASYGLQGNVFGTHNQSHTNAGLQNLNFLSQMQYAMNVQQQYRSQNLQNTSYLKSISNQQVGDQSGRSQQLKSPGTQQEVLSSVFNSGPGSQIPSPKSRQNCKQPPPQPSPTNPHKYNLYQSVGNQQSSQGQRYPQPIQRPSVNFQPNLNSVQSNGCNNHKHRTNNNTNKGPARQYYSPQGGGLTNQNEKAEDSKLVDGGTSNPSNAANSNSASIVNKTPVIGSVTNATINKTEIAKDKDESSVIKD
ncbi:BAT2 N-terminus [Popillia japonica]|uniref:BAT2 N-terminus n=1 Tax=Popillia japonica TaxID=7064 RepID=A0AAW1LVB0_POPJA